jgi:hypothetical protein
LLAEWIRHVRTQQQLIFAIYRQLFLLDQIDYSRTISFSLKRKTMLIVSDCRFRCSNRRSRKNSKTETSRILGSAILFLTYPILIVWLPRDDNEAETKLIFLHLHVKSLTSVFKTVNYRSIKNLINESPTSTVNERSKPLRSSFFHILCRDDHVRTSLPSTNETCRFDWIMITDRMTRHLFFF